MNKCFFIGRTTKEVELRYTQGNQPIAVANVSIAVEDGYGDNKTTSFFDLVIWGKRAESFDKYCPKGTKVAIEARAKQNHWKDKNGNNRYSVSFQVDNWEFAQSKADAEKTGGDDFMDVDDSSIMEDLPFN